MRCCDCPFFTREDYAWGWCTKDGVQKESMQRCTVHLLGIYRTTGGGYGSGDERGTATRLEGCPLLIREEGSHPRNGASKER